MMADAKTPFRFSSNRRLASATDPGSISPNVKALLKTQLSNIIFTSSMTVLAVKYHNNYKNNT